MDTTGAPYSNTIIYGAQSTLASILTALSKFIERDVTIQCSDGQVMASRTLLSSRSATLAALLNPCSPCNEGKERRIALSSSTSTEVKIFVEYVQFGRIDTQYTHEICKAIILCEMFSINPKELIHQLYTIMTTNASAVFKIYAYCKQSEALRMFVLGSARSELLCIMLNGRNCFKCSGCGRVMPIVCSACRHTEVDASGIISCSLGCEIEAGDLFRESSLVYADRACHCFDAGVLIYSDRLAEADEHDLEIYQEFCKETLENVEA